MSYLSPISFKDNYRFFKQSGLFAVFFLTPLSLVDAPLSAQDLASHAVNLSQSWESKATPPSVSMQGKILFNYGSSIPTVVCKPLFICDVELQPGELINDILIGDSTRWIVMPAVSGSGDKQVSHIIVKPTDIDLRTTLIITTDRRTYHINLISSETGSTPYVGFNYPQDPAEAMNYYRSKIAASSARSSQGGHSRSPNGMNFNYSIGVRGKREIDWQPLRIYDDGTRTFIDLPENASNVDLPVFFIIDSKGEQLLVNYRIRDNRYIIDRIFNEAVLISGVGKHRQELYIRKN